MNWRTRKERSNLQTVRMARRLTQWLPRRIARWLLVPTVLYFLVATRPARLASTQFLARVLPRTPGLPDVFRH